MGVGVGIFAGQSKIVGKLLSPMLQFIAPVPVVVWIPFTIMLFGTGELYKASLPMLATFLLVYIQTFQGVRAYPQGYSELVGIYEKSNWQKISRVILPSFAAIGHWNKNCFAISWIAIFIVEYSSAEQGFGGLGWFIADTRDTGRVEDQFAGVLVLGVIGFISDSAVAKWQSRKLRWMATLGSTLSQREGL